MKKLELRGWALDVMSVVEKLGKPEFALSEVYMYEDWFRKRHPDNKHIKDKIRQQLQLLRDNGYIKFLGNGRYRKI